MIQVNYDFSPRVGQSVADSEIVTNAECIFSPKKLVRRKNKTDKVLNRWDLLKAGANSPNSKKWGRRWGCTLFHTNRCRVKTAETIRMCQNRAKWLGGLSAVLSKRKWSSYSAVLIYCSDHSLDWCVQNIKMIPNGTHFGVWISVSPVLISQGTEVMTELPPNSYLSTFQEQQETGSSYTDSSTTQREGVKLNASPTEGP